MDLLKVLVTLSVLLSLYIIYSWWSRTGGLSRFSTQYHVLGCYASDTINNYPAQIRADLEKLNSYEDRLQGIDFNNLQWLDKLLPELSNKLQLFEKNYYESKADNVKSLLVQKKLQDAIKQHQQCLARVSYSNPQDCQQVRRSQVNIKSQIDSNLKDINRFNNIKKNLEEDFENQKQRKPAPQPNKPTIISKDEEIAKERTNLLNTKDKIRNLQKQKIILLERAQTNRDNLDRCAASHQLAKICETITATLEEFVDQQYHIASIQERIDMKTRQFKILKDAIEGCTSNCDETNREADACRQQLVHLIKLQAELRQKQAKCKQLCTKQQIQALQQQRVKLQAEIFKNSQNINDANNLIKSYSEKIGLLQLQNIVLPPVIDPSIEPNQKLKKISDEIANVYKQIKQKHGQIQILLNDLQSKDDKFSEHARNIEILNSCAVLRQVAEKLARQVDEQSRVPGSKNRIEYSKTQLIKLLDTIKKYD